MFHDVITRTCSIRKRIAQFLYLFQGRWPNKRPESPAKPNRFRRRRRFSVIRRKLTSSLTLCNTFCGSLIPSLKTVAISQRKCDVRHTSSEVCSTIPSSTRVARKSSAAKCPSFHSTRVSTGEKVPRNRPRHLSTPCLVSFCQSTLILKLVCSFRVVCLQASLAQAVLRRRLLATSLSAAVASRRDRRRRT